MSSAVLNSICTRTFLLQERFQALVDLIAGVFAFPLTTTRVCLRLLGHMAACTYVVGHARLQMWLLQQWLATVYSQSRDHLEKIITIPPTTLTSLQWWTQPQSGPGREFHSMTFVTPSIDMGHLRPRLGSASQQSPDPGHVIPRGDDIAHKRQGNQSGTFGLQSLSTAPGRQGGESGDGQYGLDVLHQQARGEHTRWPSGKRHSDCGISASTTQSSWRPVTSPT